MNKVPAHTVLEALVITEIHSSNEKQWTKPVQLDICAIQVHGERQLRPPRQRAGLPGGQKAVPKAED